MDKKILIVEDEQAMAKALELKLDHAGFETEVVQNGEEALDLLGAESFDAIILDLIMPKMDGFDFLQQIKEKGITTPVIVASNLGQEEDIERAKALGAKDYFIKSNVSINEIVVKVAKHIV